MARAATGARWVAHLVGLAIFAGSALYAFVTPMAGAPDEPAHVIRAVAVAHGQWTTARHAEGTPIGALAPITNLRVGRAYAELMNLSDCWAFQPAVAATCQHPMSGDTTTVPAITYVGAYPHTVYAAVGWVSWFLSPHRAVLAMRLLCSLYAAALIAGGLRTLLERRPDRRAAALLATAVALTPGALALFGSVNPNGTEVAAAAGVWLGLIGWWSATGPLTRRQTIRLVIASLVAVSARPLSALWWVTVVAVVVVGLWHAGRDWFGRRGRMVAAGVAAVAGVFAAWALISGSPTAVITGEGAGRETRWWFLRRSLDALPGWTRDLVGRMGWIDTPVPRAAVVMWVGALAVIVIRAWPGWSTRLRLAWLAVLAATAVLPVTAQTMSGPSIGWTWQGRYLLPVAVGLALLTAVDGSVGGREFTGDRTGEPSSADPSSTSFPIVTASTANRGRWSGLVIVGGVAFGHLASMVQVVHRFALGLPVTNWWTLLTDTATAAALPWPVVLCATLLWCAAITVGMWWALRRPVPSVEEHPDPGTLPAQF